MRAIIARNEAGFLIAMDVEKFVDYTRKLDPSLKAWAPNAESFAKTASDVMVQLLSLDPGERAPLIGLVSGFAMLMISGRGPKDCWLEMSQVLMKHVEDACG